MHKSLVLIPGERMVSYIIRRLLLVIPIILGVILFALLIPRLVPGDVVQMMIGSESVMSPERREAMRRLLGLDRSFHVQFWDYTTSLVRGDFGTSLRTGDPIFPRMISRLRYSLGVALLGTIMGLFFASFLGTAAAIFRNTGLDVFVRTGSLLGLSIPRFWSGTLLLLVATRYFRGVFPTVGTLALGRGGFLGFLRVSFLPSLTIAIGAAASLARLIRSGMLETLAKDFVRTARSKGIEERKVLFKHVFRNALLPVVTAVGMQFGLAIGGLMLVETVFTYPGFGLMLVHAISERDYTVLQGGLVMVALIFTLVNLLVDISYAYLDPRIEYE